MRQQIRSAACVVVGILAGSFGGRAAAQGYIPPQVGGIAPITNPTVSPYINLLRPGGTNITNYFGLVRPEFDLRNAAGVLQNQAYQTDQYLNNLANYNANLYAPLVTGHNATFLNTGGRFLNRNPALPRGYLLSYGAFNAGAAGYGPYGPYGPGAGGFGAGQRNFGPGPGSYLPGAYGAGGYGASGLGAAGGLRPGVPSVGGVGYPR